MTTSDTVKQLLADTLSKLYEAELALKAPTSPVTPAVRYKKYIWIFPGVEWPYNSANTGYFEHELLPVAYNNPSYRDTAVEKLIALCGRQPAKVLRLIYRIMTTIKWCEDRTAGRARAAKEILKQQAKAVQVLDELSAMSIISKLS